MMTTSTMTTTPPVVHGICTTCYILVPLATGACERCTVTAN